MINSAQQDIFDNYDLYMGIQIGKLFMRKMNVFILSVPEFRQGFQKTRINDHKYEQNIDNRKFKIRIYFFYENNFYS